MQQRCALGAVELGRCRIEQRVVGRVAVRAVVVAVRRAVELQECRGIGVVAEPSASAHHEVPVAQVLLGELAVLAAQLALDAQGLAPHLRHGQRVVARARVSGHVEDVDDGKPLALAVLYAAIAIAVAPSRCGKFRARRIRIVRKPRRWLVPVEGVGGHKRSGDALAQPRDLLRDRLLVDCTGERASHASVRKRIRPPVGKGWPAVEVPEVSAEGRQHVHVAPLSRAGGRERGHRGVRVHPRFAQRAPLRAVTREPRALLVRHVGAVLHGEVADPVHVSGLERQHCRVGVLDRA